MPYIKLVNENENKTYNGEQGLKSLIYYIFSPPKLMSDTKRSFSFTNIFCGCEPFIAPRSNETDPDYVVDLMVMNNSFYYSRNAQNIVKHRIISFHPSDYVFPNDVNQLGRQIASYYSSKGYIAAYAVHVDSYHIHCHIAINAISYRDGNRFHIHNEYLEINYIVEKWYSEHLASIDQSQKKKQAYENGLFGDDLIKYGHIALDSKGQIYNNKHLHNNRR